MKQCQTPLSPRAALLIGAAFLSTPALAQEAAPQQAVTPPPQVDVAPQASAPATAPAVRIAPASPVVQTVPPVEQQMAGSADQAPSAADAAPTARRARPERTAAKAASAASASADRRAASSAPAPQQAAAAVPQQNATPADAQPSAAEPAPPVADRGGETSAAPVQQTSEESRVETRSTSFAPWILGGLGVLLAVAAAILLMRRRRPHDDEMVAETVTAPPVMRELVERPVVAPVAPRSDIGLAAAAATAPVMAAERREDVLPEAHVEAHVADPDEAVLEHVVDLPAPVANRPWLELGLRPVRAGTSEEEALVDIELTVGNAGDTAARDVRISTFLLADAEPTEMERLLTNHGPSADVAPMTIAPGDGTRVDAHLAVPKGEIGRTFNPVVVAEARYRLPDGREGMTSAAFRIGRAAPGSEGLGAIGASRPHLVEDVEAELIGTPDHA